MSPFAFLSLDASQFVAAFLVMFYAAGRFNTPRTVRYQTSRFQYYGSGITYVLFCELLMVAMTWVLATQPELLDVLRPEGSEPIGDSVKQLSAPLLAALALTTLLPSFPFLRDIDAWMLRKFHLMGAIPFNAARWAQILDTSPFDIGDANLAGARAYIQTSPERPDHLLTQLTTSSADGLRYRFTRVVVLYAAIRRHTFHIRFADSFPEDAALFEKKLGAFFAHCVGYFALSDQLARQGSEPVANAAANITKVIVDSDAEVRLMLARLLLSSCNNEQAMTQKLRDFGFSVVQRGRITLPLNLLAFVLMGVVVLFVGSMWISTALSKGDMSFGRAFTIGFLVAINHSLAAIFALLPKQLWSSATRDAQNERPGLAYVVSGVLTGVVSLAVTYVVFIVRGALAGDADTGTIPPFATQAKWLLLSVGLSMALAYLCDDYIGKAAPPKWLRWAEGASLALLMAALGMIAVKWIAQTPHPDAPVAQVAQTHESAGTKSKARQSTAALRTAQATQAAQEAAQAAQASRAALEPARVLLRVSLSAAIGMLFGCTVPHWYRRSCKRAHDDASALREARAA